MFQFSKKAIIYLLLVFLLGSTFSGCKKENAKDEAGKVSDEAADESLQNAVAEVVGNQPENSQGTDIQRQDSAGTEQAISESGNQKAVAERSPVEITRIEVPEQVATGAASVNTDKDDHKHDPAPALFPIGECQIEVQGIYQVKLAKDLLKEINTRRKDYGIGQLKQNTSLLACADARCKEQYYFIGHFRPDGSAFNSIAPDYIQGECIAVDYRTVKDIMEAWFSVNKSRMQLMNPDYTQCGISIYDIDDTYYIAAELSY